MAPNAAPALTPAAERLLAAASELFYAHGIRAVGVDAIADAAGTTKKTLYDRFGSKDALVALYLTHRATRWQQFLDEEIARRPPGTDRVLAVFDAAAAWSAGQLRGCAFVNAYAEVGGTDHPALAVIRAEKDWMRRRLTELVGQAGIDRPGPVAATIHLLYEGALVTSTAGNDPAALSTAREAAARLLARPVDHRNGPAA
jgi:AcrR family transcriptional regulator